MSANDLMIGDYILFHHYWYASDGSLQKQDRICQVEKVENECFPIVKWWLDDEDYETEYAASWEPIPLTEEIIMKNFPTPEILSWFPLDTKPGYFNVYWYGDEGIGGEVHLNIQYVHELQHILNLLGIHKEITL